jgi:hypothetical protein
MRQENAGAKQANDHDYQLDHRVRPCKPTAELTVQSIDSAKVDRPVADHASLIKSPRSAEGCLASVPRSHGR